jgi:uncharacterized membrane protein SirB2
VIEFYPQIRLVHVSAVLASGALFAVRGLARQLGAAWPLFAPVRYLSYTIDTVLLTAAFMLMTMLHQYPFAQPWLTVKVILVVVYIGLGAFAISYGSTPRMRWLCYLAAIVTFGTIVSIARHHHPLGFLSRWG